MTGLFLSMAVSRFAEVSAKKMGIARPGLQAGVIRWVMILFTFMVTLSHFGFPSDFILVVLAAAGVTLCVTFVIAVGFGGIPCVPKILDQWMK